MRKVYISPLAEPKAVATAIWDVVRSLPAPTLSNTEILGSLLYD